MCEDREIVRISHQDCGTPKCCSQETTNNLNDISDVSKNSDCYVVVFHRIYDNYSVFDIFCSILYFNTFMACASKKSSCFDKEYFFFQ